VQTRKVEYIRFIVYLENGKKFKHFYDHLAVRLNLSKNFPYIKNTVYSSKVHFDEYISKFCGSFFVSLYIHIYIYIYIIIRILFNNYFHKSFLYAFYCTFLSRRLFLCILFCTSISVRPFLKFLC
jgi:hypothetical protein